MQPNGRHANRCHLIREDHLIASDLRFVHRCHASPNVDARNSPRNNPTVQSVSTSREELTKAGADTDDILGHAREGATNLRLLHHCRQKGQCRNCSQSCRCHGQTLHQKGATWIMTRRALHKQMWHTGEPPTSPFWSVL